MINDELNQVGPEDPEVNVTNPPDGTPNQSPVITFIVKILLVVWILSYITLTLSILINTWVHQNQGVCDVLSVANCEDLSPIFVSAMHAMLGGVLGAGVLGLVSFHRHVSLENNFDTVHAWGYIFAPWLSSVLGLTIFVLLQSGLLVLSGSMNTSNEVSLQNLAYLGIGFLSGFGWYAATRRIEKIVKSFFTEKQDEEKDKEPKDQDTKSEAVVPDTHD